MAVSPETTQEYIEIDPRDLLYGENPFLSPEYKPLLLLTIQQVRHLSMGTLDTDDFQQHTGITYSEFGVLNSGYVTDDDLLEIRRKVLPDPAAS